MANLKEIQRQIKSVKNTQKTTRAMKLVSTAKLRRTEELAKNSKVYASKLTNVLSEIACNIEKYKTGGIESPFFRGNDEKVEKVDLVFITADKGLCGGFNMQTIKAVRKLMNEYKEKDIKVRLRAIGRKGIDFFNFQEFSLLDEKVGLSSAPTYEGAVEFITNVTEDFKNGLTDKVILIHNGFQNMLTQELRVNNLMPIDTSVCDTIESNSLMDIEPEEDEAVLESLINKYIEFSLYYALLDSLAAEHSARMQAMDAATNNAKEMASSLTVKYNKARQEAITTELIEIISGVESMK
jgi:F-type H+-transporting ATPase subunit gamma